MPNDTRLAELVDDIDIILGGHDHHYEVKKVYRIHAHTCTYVVVGTWYSVYCISN